MQNEQPPLGLTPRYIRTRDRALEIIEAIERYVRSGKAVPGEWIDELREVTYGD